MRGSRRGWTNSFVPFNSCAALLASPTDAMIDDIWAINSRRDFVATAFHSTDIPNIEVHFEASPPMMAFARTPWFVKSLLGPRQWAA